VRIADLCTVTQTDTSNTCTNHILKQHQAIESSAQSLWTKFRPNMVPKTQVEP